VVYDCGAQLYHHVDLWWKMMRECSFAHGHREVLSYYGVGASPRLGLDFRDLLPLDGSFPQRAQRLLALMNASDHGFGRRDPRIFFMSLLVVFLPFWPKFLEETDQDFGSVAANIYYSLVSDLSYFFLQLQLGPTDLFMVVPRNDAIFPKLHTNRY
jgi:hypothetical protein